MNGVDGVGVGGAVETAKRADELPALPRKCPTDEPALPRKCPTDEPAWLKKRPPVFMISTWNSLATQAAAAFLASADESSSFQVMKDLMERENKGKYAKMCRERSTEKAMVKAGQIQVMDDDHGMVMRPMPDMMGLIPTGSKKRKAEEAPKKINDAKRTRRARCEVEDVLFTLFKGQPNWALKQLVLETNQPKRFVKEILNDLCVYNKGGAHQGTYELKPEYLPKI